MGTQLQKSYDDAEELTLENLVAFLCGEQSYRGRWFGEKYEGEPAFWWRPELKRLIHSREIEARARARKLYAKKKPQFTKQWVADVLGISRPTLDKWIKNPDLFTVGAVKKLAELQKLKEQTEGEG